MNHKKISISHQVKILISVEIQKLIILLSKQIPAHEDIQIFSLSMLNENTIQITHYLPSHNFEYYLIYRPRSPHSITPLSLVLLDNSVHYVLLTQEEFHFIVS